jgi:amino acid transporter
MFTIILTFTLGSLAIAAVLPKAQISLTAGIMQAFKDLLGRLGLDWFLPVLGFLATFGTVGGVTAWLAGPSKGLLATAKDGELPPFMQRTNQKGVQVNILLVQGAIVSLITLVYVVMPNVSAAFFLLTSLTASLYLIMYAMLYASAIRLRYTQPQVERPYRAPGGMIGIWLIAGLGMAAVIFALVTGFFPPEQLAVGSPAFYVIFLAVGVLAFLGAPLLISKLKKPSWTPQPAGDRKD